MMKWESYRSLVDQASALSAMLYEKNKVPKPLLAKEKAEEINEILCTYSGEDVTVTYWEDGYIKHIDGQIDVIDAVYKFLKVGFKRISFRELTGLERLTLRG
ncbi:MAG: YolD-like family protein [Bacillota bacterium]|nr:YolD-like family protein [Bacillota bacterium]